MRQAGVYAPFPFFRFKPVSAFAQAHFRLEAKIPNRKTPLYEYGDTGSYHRKANNVDLSQKILLSIPNVSLYFRNHKICRSWPDLW